MISAIRLPALLVRHLDATLHSFLYGQSSRGTDFSHPLSEEALVPPHSIAWRVFKNPIALFVGGTAAVILELAEPSVRAGVWEFSSFRKNPLKRLQRTGLAAMITVYGARSIAEPMIAGVVQMHESIQGTTAAGAQYSANDPRLLTWVHATAAFGFAQAYHQYAEPLSVSEFDRFYAEGIPSAERYGAFDSPRSVTDMNTLLEANAAQFAPSSIIFDFLRIMGRTPAFPRPLRWMQPMLVRAAIELIPPRIREQLGLMERAGLAAHERWLTRMAGAAANRIVLPASPAVQSCLRLGLPMGYLYD